MWLGMLSPGGIFGAIIRLDMSANMRRKHALFIEWHDMMVALPMPP